MKHEHNAFENQIFDHFREKVKAINNAIELLIEHKYKVIDLENQIIDKNNIKNLEKRYSFNYKRTPKKPYEKTEIDN
jgi:hypothetical protein